MSANDENEEEAEYSELIWLETEATSNGIIDNVDVGDLEYPVWYVDFVQGKTWPEPIIDYFEEEGQLF